MFSVSHFHGPTQTPTLLEGKFFLFGQQNSPEVLSTDLTRSVGSVACQKLLFKFWEFVCYINGVSYVVSYLQFQNSLRTKWRLYALSVYLFHFLWISTWKDNVNSPRSKLGLYALSVDLSLWISTWKDKVNSPRSKLGLYVLRVDLSLWISAWKDNVNSLRSKLGLYALSVDLSLWISTW